MQTQRTVRKAKTHKLTYKIFCGDVKFTQLICRNEKNVPEILQKFIKNWYHAYLLYPVMVITEANISQQ